MMKSTHTVGRSARIGATLLTTVALLALGNLTAQAQPDAYHRAHDNAIRRGEAIKQRQAAEVAAHNQRAAEMQRTGRMYYGTGRHSGTATSANDRPSAQRGERRRYIAPPPQSRPIKKKP